MKPKVKVLDSEGQILFECPIEERDKAFDYATEMEKLGIEVTLQAPSLPESLALELGMTEEEQAAYRDTIDAEIEEHDLGCCFEKPDGPIQ